MLPSVCRRVFLVVAVLSLVTAPCLVAASDDEVDDSRGQPLKFKMPELSDDEQHSPWVPDQLKCDACRAVSYQLWHHFEKFNARHKYKKYNLLESDIMEITDELCGNTDLFNGYGVKSVNDVHSLTGPGIETPDKPGVIAGGGKWAARLLDLCDRFMGEVGEEKIYGAYKKKPKDRKTLEDFLCRGSANSVRGQCTKADDVVYDGDDDDIDRDEL